AFEEREKAKSGPTHSTRRIFHTLVQIRFLRFLRSGQLDGRQTCLFSHDPVGITEDSQGQRAATLLVALRHSAPGKTFQTNIDPETGSPAPSQAQGWRRGRTSVQPLRGWYS